MAAFTSKINGNDIYAKRAEATRSGVNLETFGTTFGILPEGIQTPTKASDTANTLATQKYVLDNLGDLADALVYKGVVSSDANLPTTGYKKGWTYKVALQGTYAGKKCEAGDMLIANKDYASGDDPTKVWDVIEHNIDGAVSGPASSTNEDLAMFSGDTGKVIQGSGVSLTALTAAMSNANSAYQKPSSGIPAADLAQGVQDSLGLANSAYQLPQTGIPSTDLASAVQVSLGKADSSAQGIKIGSEGSTISPDSSGIVTLPTAEAGEGPGMVSYDTVNL